MNDLKVRVTHILETELESLDVMVISYINKIMNLYTLNDDPFTNLNERQVNAVAAWFDEKYGVQNDW